MFLNGKKSVHFLNIISLSSFYKSSNEQLQIHIMLQHLEIKAFLKYANSEDFKNLLEKKRQHQQLIWNSSLRMAYSRFYHVELGREFLRVSSIVK